MASLFVVRGRDQGKHFSLTAATSRIGREASCEIRLMDSEASRSHAELRRSGNDFVLCDLGSSNGTLVNGQRVSQVPLASGDRIEIGGTLLIFTGTSSPAGRDTAHGVEIVTRGLAPDASRIISSLPGTVKESLPIGVASETSRDYRVADTDRSLEVMYLTAIAVGRTNDIPELLNRILKIVFDWVDADRGCIMLREGESQRLRPAARIDRQATDESSQRSPESKRSPGRMSISRTILDYVMEHKEGVRTSDAVEDARFDAAQSIVQNGVREALCVPLQGRYGIVGAIYIDTYTSSGSIIRSGYRERFNDEHLRLLTAIGHQAALAIEDTFYYSAMVQSERLAVMGQTIATLSHHIKNILQGIRGGSYLIEAGLQRNDTAAVRRGWSMVDRNQERISSLVMDMLTFSKEREPEKVDADLNELVTDVAELMKARADEMQVSLVLQLASDLPRAHFDPEAMHRATLNIVTNAIDAAAERMREENEDASLAALASEDSGENNNQTLDPSTAQPLAAATRHDASADHTQADRGQTSSDRIENAELGRPRNMLQGRVTIETAYAATTGWIIRVTDNGYGVSPQDRERIFSLFESSKGARGTGLGLPVSDKILREHGGRIEIEDAATPPGACFVLHLPPEPQRPEATQTNAIHPDTADKSLVPESPRPTDHLRQPEQPQSTDVSSSTSATRISE